MSINMQTTTIRKAAPIAGFVLACLAFAALALTFASCKTDDVLLPQEKAQVDALDVKAKAESDAVKAAEAEAKDALGEWASAIRANDAEAQGAALARLRAADKAWGDAIVALEATMKQSDMIVESAQGRATSPLVETSKLLGLPAPLAEIGVLIGGSLLFDRSRKHWRNTIVNTLKGNLREAIMGPFRALGWAHSSYDPRVLLEAAAKQAREKGDVVLEAQIRDVLGTLPTLAVPANTTVGAAVAGGAA